MILIARPLCSALYTPATYNHSLSYALNREFGLNSSNLLNPFFKAEAQISSNVASAENQVQSLKFLLHLGPFFSTV